MISLVAVSEASHKVSINVYDGETIKYVKKKAVKTALSGAEVIARKGLNNKTGEQVTTGTTDADGNLVIELVSGVYTLEIRLNGYAVGYKTVVVDEDKNVSAALTKPVKDKEMKVVLSWDGEQDLDSYLFTPYKAKKGNMAYIGGNAKKDKHGNSLYLDGKNGNNVEIINIANIKKGNYKYYVSDYTNSITKNYSAKDMAGLNIRVEVYDKNGLVAVYIIPYNPNGVIWEVFEIKNGKVVPLQNTYKNVKGKKWWIEKKEVGKKKKEIGEKKDEIEKKEEETEKKETQLGENKLYKTGDVVIPLKYDWAGSFSEGLAVVGIEGKWGFIDKSGNEVVPLKYGYADEFSEGFACVSLTNKYKKDKYGFIDKSGNEVVPLKYDWAGSFSEGLAMVKLDGRWSFIDKLGNEILQLSNGDGENFSEGLAMVGSRGIVSFGYYFDQYGFVDRLGNEVVPLEYSSASSFREGLARVSNFGSHGFIDKSGNKVVPLKYDSAGSFSEGLAPVKLDGRWGFIDMSGNEVVPLKYDDVWSFSEGFAPVKLNDRWGFIDRSGNEVLQQLEYDEVLPFSEGFARVRLTDKYNEDKYGFIDKSGKLAVPLKYDWAGSFSEGLAAVSLNDKWGFISR